MGNEGTSPQLQRYERLNVYSGIHKIVVWNHTLQWHPTSLREVSYLLQVTFKVPGTLAPPTSPATSPEPSPLQPPSFRPCILLVPSHHRAFAQAVHASLNLLILKAKLSGHFLRKALPDHLC